MAKRKRSERATPLGQAQDRSSEKSAAPPAEESPIQAASQPDEVAQTLDRTTPQARTLSRDEVATRAYHLYQQRGGGDGGDLDDWLQAERDLEHRG
jgi:hypothetical protein